MRYVREDSNGVMTIGFVSPAWPPGEKANGVATYTADMAGALRALGHRPYVITRSRRLNSDEEEFVYPAPPIRERRPWHMRLRDFVGYRVAPARTTVLRMASTVAAQINTLSREEGVEIVEIAEAFGLARRLASRIPIPIVVRLHGPEFLVGQSMERARDTTFCRRVRDEGVAIARAAGVSAPSEDVLQRVRHHYGLTLADAEVIPNPTSPVPRLARWNPERCERGLILFVGRFDRCKGADTMVAAFKRVAQLCPDSRLILVGPDQGLMVDEGKRCRITTYLEKHLTNPAVRSRIQWLDRLPMERVRELRCQAMTTVICSRYETFGLTAAEAMAAGCPVVASNVGGLAEIVRDGRNGLLCAPGDPDDLAQKIVALLGNPELAVRLGRQAASDVQDRYDPAKIAMRTLDFYRSVIERTRRRPCRPAADGSHA